jgi:hypothetical protein
MFLGYIDDSHLNLLNTLLNRLDKTRGLMVFPAIIYSRLFSIPLGKLV